MKWDGIIGTRHGNRNDHKTLAEHENGPERVT